MQAIIYKKYGTADELSLQEIEKPVPKPNEVLVRIHAASINSWDWDMLKGDHFIIRLISGVFEPKYKILGADIAGIIEAIGNEVTDFEAGDAVFGDIAESGFGGFAQYVSVPAKLLAKKPDGITFIQAAAIPQAGLLALQGLRYKSEIKDGQKILINGAGGGAGTLAVQYAKLFRTEVTCVDKEEKFEMLRSLGADICIDYTKQDYTKTGKQYDKILDVIAHRNISDYKRALAPNGVFAMVGGSMGGLLLQLMLFGKLMKFSGNKKIGIMGYKPNRNDLNTLATLCEEKKVVPVIDRTFTLAETAQAFRHFAEGNFKGKIIITMS
ncbi:MAG: NAD(P)-dependent alcohol dehydrogenase [Fimbriimonadaceae bacterium]|nr:NAD(P)-dependent alcohol dehydrogenase [Chitinophagales bacterium]